MTSSARCGAKREEANAQRRAELVRALSRDVPTDNWHASGRKSFACRAAKLGMANLQRRAELVNHLLETLHRVRCCRRTAQRHARRGRCAAPRRAGEFCSETLIVSDIVQAKRPETAVAALCWLILNVPHRKQSMCSIGEESLGWPIIHYFEGLEQAMYDGALAPWR